MELISVIIPVYKVEEYLDRCVQSIVDQTYTNLEIILVDDGSPDRCPQMCDEWAKKDSRIRVIHQKNAGAGAARNAGIVLAQGSILAFVDSDDYLAPQMYEHLMSILEQDIDVAECELFPTERLDEAFPARNSPFQLTVCSTEDVLKKHIADRMFCQTPVNKLYRRHTIEQVPFPEGRLIDDEFWTYRVLGNAKKAVHSNLKLYAYVQQPGSAMHLSYSLRRLHAVDAKLERLSYMSEHFPALRAHAAVNLWLTCLYQGQMSLKHLSKTDQKTAFQKLIPIAKQVKPKDLRAVGTSFTCRIWLLLSKISFQMTCRFRNMLKVGL